MYGFRALVLLAVAAGLAQAQTGAIVGTVRYVGVVPPSQRVTLTDGQVILHNDLVVDAKSKGLRDVVVMVDWKKPALADADAKPVVVDQRDMLFVPRVVSVQEGRKVRFENNDLYNHAVGAQSVLRENTFNVTTPAGRPYEHAFKSQKNPIPIGCVLHPWMRAYVMVVQHPYHAVSDAQGKIRIPDIPAGKHTLVLVHPDTSHRATVEIEVQAGKTTEVAVEWKELKK